VIACRGTTILSGISSILIFCLVPPELGRSDAHKTGKLIGLDEVREKEMATS